MDRTAGKAPNFFSIGDTSSNGWVFNCDAILGGGFKDFLFSPLLGEDSHFD